MAAGKKLNTEENWLREDWKVVRRALWVFLITNFIIAAVGMIQMYFAVQKLVEDVQLLKDIILK